MSRRPAGPDRTEQNRATLKQLVKLESNKSCADCKRNKHPRWASWNIGVFICIRCSGIHRGMGTHISRVKSVDLDSWTDEQMASMLRWGNARANKYWEHKLAEGHVPNEAKIENFIRTKYDSKRWVMDGPIPDPATLEAGEADDDVPLNVVQQQAKERVRSASIRNGQTAETAMLPPRPKQPEVDLFGDVSEPAPQPARPNTAEPAISRPAPPKAPAAQPKHTKPGESLLGLDFFGGSQSSPPARPSSTGPKSGGTRSDLKQSILSLYASKPAAPPMQPAASALSGMSSPPLASPTGQPQSNAQALGGLGDAFGSLSFSSQPPQPKPAPFSNFSPPAGHSRQASQQRASTLSGGGFFDSKPSPPPKSTSPPTQTVAATRQPSNSFGADFGDFSSAQPPVTTAKTPHTAASAMGDLFDLSNPEPPKSTTASNPPPIKAANYSAFNLSQPTPAPAPAPTATQTSKPPQPTAGPSFGSANVWDSNDAWASPDPEPAAKPAPQQASISSSTTPKAIATPTASSVQTPFDSGWSDAEPVKAANTPSSTSGFSVQQDEEFGGWSHASPVATTPSTKQSGLGGNQDDLFGNVWG